MNRSFKNVIYEDNQEKRTKCISLGDTVLGDGLKFGCVVINFNTLGAVIQLRM